MPLARGHAGWDEYWASSRLGSCVPENPEIARTIAAFWLGRFLDQPPGTRILDVATGNGIVLAYAAEAARRGSRRYALTGVDLAAIDPARHAAAGAPLLREITFLGGVPAEQLPFADGSFDRVCSQYGLEYADLPRALAEAARVLAPGGRLLWMAHHLLSDVVTESAGQRRELDYLLGSGSVYAAMRGFVEAHARRRDPERAAMRLQAALREAQDWCRANPPARIVAGTCSEFVEIARRPGDFRAEDLVRMLDDGERRLRMHRLRIDDLAGAVLTPPRLEVARAALSGPGWSDLRVQEIRVGPRQSCIGVLVEASRVASPRATDAGTGPGTP
ncbi:MAG: class I SAM-dependent methyltransferase [Steroidobacteraceae bacterium]|nr:class I SAM-dependent methyltransferase [Steroidobacteraceae bacterium]